MRIFAALLCVLLVFPAGAAGLIQSTTSTKESQEVSPGDEDAQRGIKKRKKEVILDDRQFVPDFGPVDSEKVLPPLAPEKEKQVISTLSTIPVNQIKLQGSTVVPNSTFNSIVKPYLDKSQSLSMQDLQEIRLALSEWYVKNGYINSGVIIPDQKIENNTIILQSIEGTLNDVNISGSSSIDENYLKGRIFQSAGKPLHLASLQNTLREIQQDPVIQTISGKLNPGDALGTAVLDIKLLERSPYVLHYGINNYRSPSIGEENLYVRGGINNLTGRSDTLLSEFSISEGIKDLAVNYGYPLDYHRSQLNAYFSASDSIIVEEPFDQIDIESLSTVVGGAYTYFIEKTSSSNLAAVVGLEIKHSESTLLEEPFVFSLGADENGETDDTVLYLGLNWLNRSETSALAWNNTLRYGIDALGATSHSGSQSDLPDGEFWVIQSGLKYAMRLGMMDSELSFNLGLQFADDTLLAMEKYSIGGVYSVRGYRENQYVRDSGYNASMEWKIPVVAGKNTISPNILTLSLFADYASAQDEDEALTGTEKETISSLGFGLYWKPIKNLNIEFFAAHALDDVPDPSEDSLQDDGIHFAIDYNHPF